VIGLTSSTHDPTSIHRDMKRFYSNIHDAFVGEDGSLLTREEFDDFVNKMMCPLYDIFWPEKTKHHE